MNEKVFAQFACSAQEVLQLMLDIEASACAPASPYGRAESKDAISVAIGLTGEISGEAYFGFPRDTALEMVKIMSGMEISEVDDFVTSAIGEISNIISGKAATGLSEQKIVCDILPPKIAVTKDVILSENEASPMRNTTIHTTAGNIDLTVRLS